MDELLRGLGEEFCHIYMDDILVFSRTWGEHRRHLRQVLERVRQFGMTLSREKCTFAAPEVGFLGHIVSAAGVRPDPGKVEALKQIKLPATVRGVRGLLGSLNYYRRFVPGMATELVPLNNMLRKGQRVEWTPAAEEGVRRCIAALGEPPILKYPDFTKDFCVQTDASAYAIGAVLTQEYAGVAHPVAYASRRLTPAEERYSTIERELLGVVWAVQQFRPYVYGRRFTIRTDHKPLQWVGTLKETSARVSRWKETLAGYSFRVVHVPGKENILADWLSRAHEAYAVEDQPGPSGEANLRQYFQSWSPGEDEEPAGGRDTGGSAGTEGEGSTELDRSGIREVEEVVNKYRYQVWWRTRQSGLDSIDEGRRGNRRIFTVTTTPGVDRARIIQLFKSIARPGKTYHLYIGNETIWRKVLALREEEQIGRDYTLVRCRFAAINIDDPQQQREVALAHHVGKTNHRGVTELEAALRRRYFWDRLRETAAAVVAECELCNRAKPATRPPRGLQEMTPTAEGPMCRLEMDTMVWRGHRWITLIDTFSKWVAAREVRGGLVETVLEALRDWIDHYGIPEEVVADGGPEFRSDRVRREATALEIRWHTNTPGHPQGRGAVERVHATLGDHLRILQAEGDRPAEEAMHQAVRAYNHSIHTATGFAPVEVVFGDRRPRRHLGPSPEPGTRGHEIRAVLEEKKRLTRRVRERLLEEKARRVLRANVRVHDAAGRVTIGTKVYRKRFSRRRKEEDRFTGPYIVVAMYTHQRFRLEACDGSRRRVLAHLNELKLPLAELQDVTTPGGL